VPRRPVELELRQPAIDALGRRAAGERDRERVVPACAVGDPARAELG
jgi:hypothetical protein